MENTNAVNLVNQPIPTPYAPKPKEYFKINKKEKIFSALLFLVSFCFVAFGLWGGFNLGFSISYVLFFGVMLSYLVSRKTRISAFAALSGLLSLLLSLSFGFYNYAFLKVIALSLIFMLSAVFMDSLCEPYIFKGNVEAFVSIFTSTFGRAFENVEKTLRSLFRKEKEGLSSFAKVMIGIACALPLVLIIVPILIRSDAAFEGLMSAVAEDMFSFIFKLVLSFAVCALLISYALSTKTKTQKQKTLGEKKGIEAIFVSSFLGVISLCYLTYLFSQLSYFFNAFLGFLPKDYNFTVSEYARRGFFEMFAIAIINILIVFVTMLISKKKNYKVPLSVRMFNLFISIFTLIIISTALSKMVLYIKSFGLTRLRVGTSCAMLVLFVTFIAVIVKCFVKRSPILKTFMICAAVVAIALSFFNIDNIVCRYNINSYKSGALKTLDVDTISELGNASVPYLIELTEDKDANVSYESRYALYEKIEMMYIVKSNKLQARSHQLGAYNFVDKKAYDALDKFIKKEKLNGEKIQSFLYEDWRNYEYQYM